uniref:Chemokine interleukin-8-like domain-containing protein n=1 Tax=Sinocyclocheilus anshuiensis TaxID=1608454 RepID=A0A671NYK6_9TELE
NKMKTAFIVLVCLLVVEVKGELATLPMKGRCICAIEKVEIIPSTLQKCLNPGSKLTKNYIIYNLNKRKTPLNVG